jgi:response regulator RpfG family c-di-GMP phosphodiesterase
MAKGKLLVVDDDKMFLKLLVKILERAYDLKSALSGEDGLEILESGFKPDVIISDQVMPGMTGSELLEKSINYVPNAARIIITGHSSSKEIIAAINKGKAFMYIKKPSSELEIFQAAHVGYEHFKSKIKIDEMNKSSSIRIEGTNHKLDEVRKINDELNAKVVAFNEKQEKLDKRSRKLKKQNEELNEMVSESNQKLEEAYQLIDNEEERNKGLLEFIKDNDAFPDQSAMAISELIRQGEKFYFNDHTYNVSLAAKALAEELKLSTEQVQTVTVSGLMHNVVKIGMPDIFQLVNANELDDKARMKYFTYFNRAIRIFLKIHLLNKHTTIIAQQWEHLDGSGFPKALSGKQLSKESQIIAITNLYHNMVYQLQAKDYEQLRKDKEISQLIPVTNDRHKAAIKYFFKHAKWFDPEVLQAFQEIITDKSCEALQPKSEILKIRAYDHFASGVGDLANNEDFDKSGAIDGNSGKMTEETVFEGVVELDNKQEDQIKMEEKIIETEKVRVGMIVSRRIQTVSGVVVVKSNTELKAENVKKVIQLHVSGLVGDYVSVMVPTYNI